jgi:hypothetical protein
MSDPSQALPAIVLTRKLEGTKLTAREIRTLTHDAEFQAIADRNSRLVFGRNDAAFECGLSINAKEAASAYDVTVGHVKKLLHTQRKRKESPLLIRGCPPILAEEQERELVTLHLSSPADSQFLTKRDLLEGVEKRARRSSASAST